MSDDNDSGSNSWGEDEAEYSPKSEFSKPKVVEDATRKCFELRSKEMKRGYYNTQFTKEGLPLKTWVEDSRKAYCSAVIAFRHLLTPEILGDEKYKHIKLGTLRTKYSYYALKRIKDGELIKYVESGSYHLPDMDEAVNIRKIFPNGNEELIRMEGYWNPKVNAYWDHMVNKCDLMFQELMRVIHRLNYFKSGLSY